MPYVVNLIPPPQEAFKDIPSNFGIFPDEDDLLLGNLEVKEKLKPGLPPLMLKVLKEYKPKTTASRSKTSSSSKSSSTESSLTSSSSEKKADPPKPKKKSESSHGSLDGLSSSKSRKSNSGSSSTSDSSSESPTEEKAPEPPAPVDPYAGMTPEQREKAEKEHYLHEWMIIRKKYPKKTFPEFADHDDLEEIKKAFDRTKKELEIDAIHSQYRMYLMVTFYVLELLLQFMTRDIEGFANFQSQYHVMATYDSLLIELGQKTQKSWFSSLPVEVRLFGFVSFQAVIFILSKVLSRRGGANVTNILYTFIGVEPPPVAPVYQQPTAPVAQPASRMQGPRHTAEDIRNMAKAKKE